MKKVLLVVAGCWLLVTGLFAQTVPSKLQQAFQQFEADPQLKHAISSLYVIDAATGQVVFDKNSKVGLAPASTQKIITAVTAFELLGKDYRYQTLFSLSKKIHPDSNQQLLIQGTFDPTLGSDRFVVSGVQSIFKAVTGRLKEKNIKNLERVTAYLYTQAFNPLPGGYIWSDIGNYFGAGIYSLNWRENQYDMILRSNSAGVSILETSPMQKNSKLYNFLSVGKPGSGDNAYIYAVPFSNEITVRGTIPPDQNRFVISGSMSNPAKTFSEELYEYLGKNAISFSDSFFVQRDASTAAELMKQTDLLYTAELLYSHYSPSLDSIIYWFLQKSINLYGEALLSTFSNSKRTSVGMIDGVKITKDFWKQNGISEDELNISDGSGLSPQNRVTTHAQVEILKYAKKRPWFSYFYQALPEYNGMKMKSGTIKDVKGFCGYHKAANGREYIFSFLVNNYNGATSDLVSKMYRVLNVLK